MRTKLKYGSKPVYWNDIHNRVLDLEEIESYRFKGKLKIPASISRFDSTHEFLVYRELVRIYGEERVFRQVPLEIVRPSHCYPKGKAWKVDFAIAELVWGDKHIKSYVEAKGAFLPEFGYVLSALEELHPTSFLKLKIIFGNEIPRSNKIISALMRSSFSRNIFTLKELKERKRL
jgi:hypothetical protein